MYKTYILKPSFDHCPDKEKGKYNKYIIINQYTIPCRKFLLGYKPVWQIIGKNRQSTKVNIVFSVIIGMIPFISNAVLSHYPVTFCLIIGIFHINKCLWGLGIIQIHMTVNKGLCQIVILMMMFKARIIKNRV